MLAPTSRWTKLHPVKKEGAQVRVRVRAAFSKLLDLLGLLGLLAGAIPLSRVLSILISLYLTHTHSLSLLHEGVGCGAVSGGQARGLG